MKNVLVLLFCFAIMQIKAQLSIKNETDEPISVAIGWYSEKETFEGFITEGWWTIEPGHTINPGLYFTSNDDHFYFYAKGWSGSKQLLISDDKFIIENADLQYVKDKSSKYRWVNFKRVDVHFNLLEEKKYTLVLTD